MHVQHAFGGMLGQDRTFQMLLPSQLDQMCAAILPGLTTIEGPDDAADLEACEHLLRVRRVAGDAHHAVAEAPHIGDVGQRDALGFVKARPAIIRAENAERRGADIDPLRIARMHGDRPDLQVVPRKAEAAPAFAAIL